MADFNISVCEATNIKYSRNSDMLCMYFINLI